MKLPSVNYFYNSTCSKAIHGLGPEYINCVVECCMPVRALRSSCNGILLKVTVPRKTIGQSSFAVASPHMWNDLPIDVRSARSLTSFRKHLKTFFISASLMGLNIVTCFAAFIKTFSNLKCALKFIFNFLLQASLWC